jgi:8-oxo-dGTP pyrophosphatase MutT (NUDIX family)
MPEPYWKVLARRTIYDSPWVRLHQDDVRLPDGSVIEGHHVVEVPRAAVGVVPVGPDGRILLIEHYRFITDTTGWEVPAGAIDAGEDALAAAAREMREESGHAADRIEHLGDYHPSIGVSSQRFHLCLGHGARRVGPILDTNEVIQARWFEPDEVRAMIQRSAIRDGLSLTALLWYFARKRDRR